MIELFKLIELFQILCKYIVVSNYCTTSPAQQTGASWPSSISAKLDDVIAANCTAGYIVGVSGAPIAKCLSGADSQPGSGVWGSFLGSCSGILDIFRSI